MGKKILLVDDDDALRDSLAEQLQLHNEFELTGVGTAEQGLDLLEGIFRLHSSRCWIARFAWI